jgi:hypothetical protein
MQIRRCIVLLMLFACIILIVGFLLSRISARNGEGLSESLTLRRFRVISYGIHQLMGDTNEPPPREMKELSEIVKDHRGFFRPLYGTKWFDPNTSAIIDHWNTPVTFSTKMRQEYTFISAGPNRVHENGKGDDIVFTFDALDPVKKPRIIIGGKTIKAE